MSTCLEYVHILLIEILSLWKHQLRGHDIYFYKKKETKNKKTHPTCRFTEIKKKYTTSNIQKDFSCFLNRAPVVKKCPVKQLTLFNKVPHTKSWAGSFVDVGRYKHQVCVTKLLNVPESHHHWWDSTHGCVETLSPKFAILFKCVFVLL